MWWEGREDVLSDGIDSAIEQIFACAGAAQPVNTLCTLAAGVPREGRARGLAEHLLTALRTIAKRHGLTYVVAPVRPSCKERYPLAPIERYVQWRRADGQLLDPWMRFHERWGNGLYPAAQVPANHRIGC